MMKILKRILPLLLAVTVLLALAPSVLAEGGEGAPTPEQNPLGGLFGILPLLLIVPIFYFMIIRPEKKRKAAAAQLRSDLTVTDEVVTMGGIVGKVVQIKDDTVTVETGGERTRITVQRNAIVTRKETLSN